MAVIDNANETPAIDAGAPEQPLKTNSRGRGRPPKADGTKPSAQTSKKAKLSSRQLAGMLVIGHAFAADAIDLPELALAEHEATAIADAIVDVMQYYDFDASGKTLAWANLLGVCASVYGLKFITAAKRKEARVE